MPMLEQQVIIITGAASGLGRAAAIRCAMDGARLSLVDINRAGLDDVKAEVRASCAKADVLTVEADVSSEDQVRAYVEQTVARFGGVDGFFNNAGIEDRQATTQDVDGAFLAGLVQLHKLEAPRQRGVSFKVLLVLRPRRRGDGAQFATRERGLEQIGGIAAAGRVARAN